MRWTFIGIIPAAALLAWAALPQAQAAPPAGGQAIYTANCAKCHQANGQGITGRVPPLAGSDYMTAPATKRIAIVLQGLKGKVVVKDQAYNNVMKGDRPYLSDAAVAAVITYVGHAWGNKGAAVTEPQVRAYRHVRESGKTVDQWRDPPVTGPKPARQRWHHR
ncbi:MAG: cytochrome c [Candidatus Sericytochromatia bacterium]|nr:cytochrome c [Candidatus Sericytochromatia bacterium]